MRTLTRSRTRRSAGTGPTLRLRATWRTRTVAARRTSRRLPTAPTCSSSKCSKRGLELGDNSKGDRLLPGGHRLKRSEEHTSELQSQSNLVCRLLLEQKKETVARQY